MAPSLINMAPADVSEHGPDAMHRHTPIAVAKLISEDMDTAFSPLSSSTITIASLGSSLGLNMHIGGKADGEKKNSSDSGKGFDITGKNTKLFDTDMAATSISSGSSVRSASSASSTDIHTSLANNATSSDERDLGVGSNMDTYSSPSASESMSPGAASPLSSSSSRMSGCLAELPKATMRSVSVDYTRAYASQHQTPHALSLQPQTQPQSTAPSVGASSLARKSFAQRLLNPLTRRQPTPSSSLDGDCSNAGSSESGKKENAAARLTGSATFPIEAKTEGNASKNKMETSTESVGMEKQPQQLDNESKENLPYLGAPASALATAAAATTVPASTTALPIPREQLQQRQRSQKQPHRSIQAKSLDIGRDLLAQARGPFNRRMMQRTKREDAIYGSKDNGSLAPVVGPARFQVLSRSLASRLGFSSTLAARRRPGDLRFIIAPHTRLPEVLEVIDCEEMIPVYRKISKSGKSWHETFHEVDLEAESAMPEFGLYAEGDDPAMMSDYEMAMALGLPYPGVAFANNYGSVSSNHSSRPDSLRNGTASLYYNGGYSGMAAPTPGIYSRGSTGLALSGSSGQYQQQGMARLGATASCTTFQTMASSSISCDNRPQQQQNLRQPQQHEIAMADAPMALSNPSTVSFVNAGTVRMGRASTSVGIFGVGSGTMASMYGFSASNGGTGTSMLERGLLWEALTPYPNQFPLHIKDARTVIDTVSLASLVLDRHNFCYRFQLGTTRMRWTAKRVKRSQLALECYVRNVLVAEIFVDYEKGYSPYNVPATTSSKQKRQQPVANAASHVIDSEVSSGSSTPFSHVASDDMGNFAGRVESSATAVLPEDGTYPVVTILPAAFAQLASFDETVVESFIIFSGMQMLECLHL
ncbi:hypothetical protein GGI25_003326 [Coemansia spiralis]|uniref:Uncharacterized protein n=2 Tax=Coemansia TaxID=4863 RepID=A0A9W8G8V6_9FUNG|nr:hypothetical protein EDC05_002570 [Coemansia umbellata]KAJ2622557.1 hypothetical protein GGI26_003156 [Coemansia sp. RSA 1358]KAJ2677106.1 hypothetical protein GGI25_003326 [Coemansia spiralis]